LNASSADGHVPIDMVSTGPDRVHTILLRHPFRR
jgi:adenylosuccinate synthase